MDWGSVEICRALNLDRYESVENLSTAKSPRWIEKCREAISQTETFSMDQEFVEKLSRQIPDSLMDRNNDKICREKKSKGLDR